MGYKSGAVAFLKRFSNKRHFVEYSVQGTQAMESVADEVSHNKELKSIAKVTGTSPEMITKTYLHENQRVIDVLSYQNFDECRRLFELCSRLISGCFNCCDDMKNVSMGNL
jgi:hypothetical protein